MSSIPVNLAEKCNWVASHDLLKWQLPFTSLGSPPSQFPTQLPPELSDLLYPINTYRVFFINFFSILPIMLGCSSDDGLRGYSCHDGCRREVEIVGSGKRRVCVRCCTGHECNKVGGAKDNETETAVIGKGAHDTKLSEKLETNGFSRVTSDKQLLVISLLSTLWLFRNRENLQS